MPAHAIKTCAHASILQEMPSKVGSTCMIGKLNGIDEIYFIAEQLEGEYCTSIAHITMDHMALDGQHPPHWLSCCHVRVPLPFCYCSAVCCLRCSTSSEMSTTPRSAGGRVAPLVEHFAEKRLALLARLTRSGQSRCELLKQRHCDTSNKWRVPQDCFSIAMSPTKNSCEGLR